MTNGIEDCDSLVEVFEAHVGWEDLRLMRLAKYGGIRGPLAAHIERGGELQPETRRWLAAFLRGEAPKVRKGAKPDLAERRRTRNLMAELLMLRQTRALTQNAAIEIYLSEHPEENPETVRSRLKRYVKRPLPQE